MQKGGVGGSGRGDESVAERASAAEAEQAEEAEDRAVLSGAYCEVLATACDDDAAAGAQQRTWSKVRHTPPHSRRHV